MRIVVVLMIGLALIACRSKKDMIEDEEPKTALEVVEEKSDTSTPLSVTDSADTKSIANQKAFSFPENAVARIQRTPCFGRCPIYTLTVYQDGTVIYEAEKFVPEEGTFQGKASPDTFQKLLLRAEEANFFEMKDKYDSEYVTDLPTTITTLRKDDVVKRIENRYQGPEELSKVQKYFDELYLNLNWSKQDGE